MFGIIIPNRLKFKDLGFKQTYNLKLLTCNCHAYTKTKENTGLCEGV